MNLPTKEGTQERQKRKRDFSKVIDIAHKALNISQTISYDSNVGFANSGIDTHPSSTLQSSQNQYATLQPSSQSSQDQATFSQQSKIMNKIQKKSHLRSLTSHKLMQPKPPASMVRKDDI